MTKKIKKYKVGIDSETYAISLVESPAIESDFVHLAEQKEEKVFLESDEKFMVYGAALIPDKLIYRNNGEEEYYISFTKESIEKMSQEFMKEYRQNEITLDHETMANDVTIVETWIKSDMALDKSVAVGLDATLPVGTWCVGMKVNQIDVWERIKSGELKGFSVESMISLEEFSKQNDNNMTIETNDMNYWAKFKEVLKEVFKSNTDEVNAELEATPSVEPTANVEPTVEPNVEPTPSVEPQNEPSVEPTVEPNVEPTVEEPKVDEPKVDEPKPTADNSHLEELVNTLKAEIEALKESNNGLQEKIKDMSKEPSTQPINTNAKPNGSGGNYAAWREQMRSMLG